MRGRGAMTPQATAASLLSSFLLGASVLASSFKPPHIVMIVMDDLGYQDLGYHGVSGILTPACDALIRQGIYLQNYYVYHSCSPTRATLLSGRYSLHTGIYEIIRNNQPFSLPLDEETLPQMLKRGANYQSPAIGKWHMGYGDWKMLPTFRGFDTFFGQYHGGNDHYTYDTQGAYDFRFDKEPNCGPGCSRVLDMRGNYSSHYVARRTVQLIEEYNSGDPPLFLYIAFKAVHKPFQVPEEYMKRYRKRSSWSNEYKTYAGMLTAADVAVQQIVNALKRQRLYNDTIIVFTTDNGLIEMRGRPKAKSQNRRGAKGTLWEGGISGDGFISGGVLPKLGFGRGFTSQHLFHVADWFPTLAKIVGVTPNGNHRLDGVNQAAIFLKARKDRPNLKKPPRREIYLGYSGFAQQQKWFGPAIRRGRWKLIQGDSGGPGQLSNGIPSRGTRKPAPGGMPGATYLLYDLETDRSELINLAANKPRVLQRLRKKLRKYGQSFVPPMTVSQRNNSCGFAEGPTGTSFYGPTWEPWCGP